MKHEQALLVGLSYVIGFVTAYIAFGIQHSSTHPVDHVAVQEIVSEARGEVQAFVDEIGLFAEVDGEAMLISARTEGLIESPGYHYAVPVAAVSPSGAFIHYCEQSLEVPTVCNHYIYDVEDHMVYPVSLSGQQLRSEVGEARAGWDASGILTIGENVSRTVSVPWILE